MSLKALEVLPSELDLFSPPALNTGILHADYVEYKPIQNLGEGPIIFNVTGGGDK